MRNQVPTILPDEAERAFIARLRAGDPDACAQCVREHSDGLYRLALRMMRDPHEAEDVVQETLLNAFRGIARFDGRSSLKTWLYRICYNTALMKLRGAKPPRVSVEETLQAQEQGEILPLALHDECCLPERDFEINDTRAQLENAIRDLPANLRVVFVLRELEGLSTLETANALNVTAQVVKVRLHRARAALRERLAGYFDELILDRQAATRGAE